MERATARHILVASKEACEDLKKQIEAGADFAAVAREHSLCPSGKKGGSLGEFGPGQMVEEFDQAVFSGEVGKVLGPISGTTCWRSPTAQSREVSIHHKL